MPISPDFVQWMQSEVAGWADKYGCQPHRAFPAWALNFIFDVADDDAFNQTDTLSQGDAGLDGWHFDRDAMVFHLVQAKYLADPVNGLVPPGDLDPLVKVALLLQDPANVAAGPHHERLTSVALELKEALLDDASVSLDYIVAGRVSDDGRRQLEHVVGQLQFRCSVTIYDTSRLDADKRDEGPIDDLSGIQVRFKLSSSNAHFEVDAPDLPGVHKAGVLTLDGRSLADAVDQWQARLFHGNVRYYLKRSNRVNKEMIRTLESEEGRRAFWLYNNGLTMVADEFYVEPDTGGIVYLVATNPQIVNGAQTSSVLRERRAHLSDGDVAVQCRVIAIAPGNAGREALERISEFTNTQSPVKAGDLRSNDKRHRTLQSSFGMLPQPVFYERRRGEWYSMTAAQKASFGGRRVLKEKVGQRYLAYRGYPAEAVTSKDDIYGGLESQAFDTTVSAHVYMLAYDLYEMVDGLMKVSGEQRLLGLVPSLGGQIDQTQPDSPTYIASLRRARALVCSHAVALAHDVLRWRYTDIGQQRAASLRIRLSDVGDETHDFIWIHVFRTIRSWYLALPDKSALRSLLQRAESHAIMTGLLNDVLVDADRSRLPSLGS